MDGCAQYPGTTSEWATGAPQPHTGWLWRVMVQGNPSSRQNFKQSPWLSIFPRMKYEQWLHESWLSVWLHSQRFGRNTVGKLITRKSREETCGKTSSMHTTCEHICLTWDCNYIRELQMSESLFPQTLMALPNGLLSKVATATRMEFTRGFGNMTSIH